MAVDTKMQSGSDAENTHLWNFHIQMDLYHTSSPKAQGTMQKRSRKTVRGRGQAGLLENAVYCMWQELCTHVLKVVDCLQKVKLFKIPAWKRLWNLCTPKEPLAIDVCWWSKTLFSPGMLPLIIVPVLVDEPSPIHIQISLIGLSAFTMGCMKLGGQLGGGIWEELEGVRRRQIGSKGIVYMYGILK